MKNVNMSDIYGFVNGVTGPKHINPGDPTPTLTDSDFELLDIHQDFDRTWMDISTSKASSDSEWHSMFRQVGEEYAPRFQAWADKHKLGYQFNMNPPV